MRFNEVKRRRRKFLESTFKGGNSQAKELLQDGTLESFLKKNTQGEA